MNVKEFAASLLNELESALHDIQITENNVLQVLGRSSSAILQSLSKLKLYIHDYHFTDPQEEIYFFKIIKPRFLSKLIYNQKAFEIQSNIPLGCATEGSTFFRDHLKQVNNYISDNKDFYIYYRSASDVLDEIYFLRKAPSKSYQLACEDFETDENFTTGYDYKLSKIMAYENIINLLEQLCPQYEGCKHGNQLSETDAAKIKWTASKASLIELLYSLHASGVCNNGDIELKELAGHFEKVFAIELGNFYRVFQEIRIRKISRTAFLDQLKERVLQKMDDTDLHPKY